VIRKSLNGIVRAISFGKSDTVSYLNDINSIYEGMIKETNPNGFGRYIESSMSVFSLHEKTNPFSISGYWLADAKFKLVYSGLMDKGTAFIYEDR